ncbi:MAG TPA: peptidylprolyl isomerase [Vicinamibacteria bacterium]|nr:peptidylprolyl isomerase [Vicinamibacteria bacterium]
MNRRRVVVLLTTALAASAAWAQAPRPAPRPAKAAVPREAPVAPGTEVVVETPKGRFTIRLLPEVAPKHAALFVGTAKAGGYDGTTFHRVVMGGIIQGGDPLTKDPAKAALYGTGGLGLLKAELSDRPFVRGTVAAVRRPSSLDSGGRQFFVVVRDQPSMKGQYTVFGEVVSGMEVVDQISATPADGDKAKERVEMTVAVREPPAAP